jgi:GNAT superfamily N-acetyltransferase
MPDLDRPIDSTGIGPVVRRLPAADAPAVVDVMCDAFRDYPVMRFVIGDAGGDDDRRLRTLIGLFVAARALRDEPLLGLADGRTLCAAATVSFPGVGEEPPEMSALREGVWRDLGHDARARHAACGEVWGTLGVGTPHVHVNMIGVRPAHQGRGLARVLLDHVQRISRETPGANGVTLTTEDPANVPFYQHVGYQIVGHGRIAPALETWAFHRRNQ